MRFLRCLVLGLLFTPTWALAYPEFIGIGYSSCLTCHYNGQGNGPLNDYGRALMSAEISARTFTTNNEERLSSTSGFLGSYQLPWWLRPGIKARNLWMQINPGSERAKNRNILMQADFNLAIHFDKAQNLVFVGGIGYQPKPEVVTTKRESYISREHYVRWHAGDPLWIYAGFLDKTYGLRIVNHTAFSRQGLQLGQNDQAHGLVFHYVQPKYEITVNPFVGNMYKNKTDRKAQQRGVAAIFDYEWAKDLRWAASVMSAASEHIEVNRVGTQVRAGIGYGASVLLDGGFIQERSNSTDITQNGYYLYTEMNQKLARGYHLFFVGQANKKDMKKSDSDFFKAGAGLLMFPLPRFELRVEVENGRQISPSDVQRESWLAMVQAHVSL